MDKAAATAAGLPLKIGEHELIMRPMRDLDIGQLDQWVRGRYIATVRETLDELSDKDRREALEIAFSQASKMTAFSPDGARLLATPEGLAKLVELACGGTVSYKVLHPLMYDPVNAEVVRVAFASLNPVPKSASRAKGPANRSTRARSTRRSR